MQLETGFWHNILCLSKILYTISAKHLLQYHYTDRPAACSVSCETSMAGQERYTWIADSAPVSETGFFYHIGGIIYAAFVIPGDPYLHEIIGIATRQDGF
jgi:hypothetical protein